MTDRVPIDAIEIGERHRRDLGDIAGLAASIDRHGMLHPVVVLADMTLVCGQRRVEACRSLGWKQIPVTVVDVEELLSAEYDENVVRKDFTPTEVVALGRLIEGPAREKAKQQIKEGGARGGRSEASVTVTQASRAPETRDVVGRAVGVSGPTYQRAKAVVEAAEKDPAKYGDLVERMDTTGKVAPVHAALRQRQAGIAAPPPKEHPNRTKAKIKRQVIEAENAVRMLGTISDLAEHWNVETWPTDRFDVWAKELERAGRTVRSLLRQFQAKEGDV